MHQRFTQLNASTGCELVISEHGLLDDFEVVLLLLRSDVFEVDDAFGEAIGVGQNTILFG